MFTRIELPESLTGISDLAFFNCNKLTRIELPESLTSMGKEVFRDCSALASIKVPAGIRSLGENIFLNCDLLKDLYFKGSKTQWEESDQKLNWSGKLPDGCTKHWLCDVSFNAMDHGAAPAAQEGLWSNEDKVADPGYLTDEGFVFNGWYTDEACTQVWDFDDYVDDDMTLYAGWKVKTAPTYTVTVENGSGDREYEEGESVTIVPAEAE